MTDPTFTPGAEPEYLGSDTPPPDPEDPTAPRRVRSPWVLVTAALGIVGAAAGGWAAAQLLGGGDGPATAVPAIAVGYVAVDLDPGAAQKIEALQMAKKFPALAEELDLGVRDDLRRWFFEQAFGERGCDLDYDRDVAAWVGDRVALAAVPDDDAPVAPLLVLQATDQEAARSAVAAIDACTTAAREGVGGEEPVGPDDEPTSTGVAFVGDYVLVTEEQEDADAFAAAAQAAPLAEDPAFEEWMAAVGEPGVVTAYVAQDAPRAMTATAAQLQDEVGGSAPPLDDVAERTRALWKDFEGMAAVVRFADGALEVETVGRGLPGTATEPTGPSLADLPAGTAAAFTHSLRDGWFEDVADALFGVFSAGESEEDFWAGLEAGSGLELPEDVERLLGDGVSLSVDASLDPEGLDAGPGDLPAVPVALRIAGDTAEIRSVLDRLLRLAGPAADQVVVEESDGLVVVGLDPTYVDRVLTERGLGEQEGFTGVVPQAGRATSALFVGFDAGAPAGEPDGAGWLARLAGDDAEARANLEPLDALGISAWFDGDVQHGLLRLTTD